LPFTPVQSGILQRKCASCSTHTVAGDKCEDCKNKQGVLQRKSSDNSAHSEVPPIVHEVLNSSGQALDKTTRAFFEPRFGYDFSHVRVHTDTRAAESALAVNALAYTVGQNIVFAPHRYQSHGFENLHLLAHELAHTVQQGTGNFGSGKLEMTPANAASEQQADEAAAAVLSEQSPQLTKGMSALHLARRGPMPAPRPPVRPAPARLPGTTAPRGAPGGSSYQGPVYVPDQSDDSFEAALQRSAIKDYAEKQRLRAERPIATLTRGGEPPKFITEDGMGTYSWIGGPSGGGTITFRKRQFHVLDAIEYWVGRANNEQDLQLILQKYVPVVALMNDFLDKLQGDSPLSGAQIYSFTMFWDDPLYIPGFDPNGQARLEVFETALEQRIKVKPDLAKSRLKPQSKRRGGCRLEVIEPMGDDPLSNLYCHAVTGSPYSYKITIETATGGATKRWAEIDSLRGNTWYECKCGYEALLSGAAKGDAVARAVLDRLDKQVLNHLDIAKTCGLEYRYIVSNEKVAEILRSRWFGNVVIDVREFDPCD